MIRLSNSDLDEDWTNGRSQVKPSKSQLKPELRYYPVTFWAGGKVSDGFQRADLHAFKGCFSEGGRDSTKKDDLKGFKESAEVYGKGIVHFPKDCKLYCGRGLARNQSGDKKGACENWRESKEIIRICIMILMTLVRCSLFR